MKGDIFRSNELKHSVPEMYITSAGIVSDPSYSTDILLYTVFIVVDFSMFCIYICMHMCIYVCMYVCCGTVELHVCIDWSNV